jgi:D-alanyl-lipoteichoic acid acyltransferase DltB (MBOAT superfamily)
MVRPVVIPLKQTVIYGVRLVACMGVMEFMLHTVHVQAITKAKAFNSLSPIELAIFSYFSLKIVWLKLLIIWRFFRFWAMADGIDSPENMMRCMSNNYSTLGFWRTWHRSYNRWIVRYIYVPLGGNRYRVYSIFVVFTFVAIWHVRHPLCIFSSVGYSIAVVDLGMVDFVIYSA